MEQATSVTVLTGRLPYNGDVDLQSGGVMLDFHPTGCGFRVSAGARIKSAARDLHSAYKPTRSSNAMSKSIGLQRLVVALLPSILRPNAKASRTMWTDLKYTRYFSFRSAIRSDFDSQQCLDTVLPAFDR
jgi:hypothetical protein